MVTRRNTARGRSSAKAADGSRDKADDDRLVFAPLGEESLEDARKIEQTHPQFAAPAGKRRQPPAWFSLADYDVQLGAAGWGRLLCRLKDYQAESGYLLWLYDRLQGPLMAQAARFEARVKATVGLPLDTALDALREVSLTEALSESFQELPLADRSILLIDRQGCPEAVLMALFEAWLLRTRPQGRISGGKRGPKTRANAHVDETNFDSWKKQQIVAYFELMVWNARHKLELTDQEVWPLLFPHPTEAEDPYAKLQYVRTVFRQALAETDALRTQAIEEPNTMGLLALQSGRKKGKKGKKAEKASKAGTK
jgi:hypothetical protein